MVPVKIGSKELAQNLSAAIDAELKKSGRELSGVCHKDVIGIIIIRIKKHSCVSMLMGEMNLHQTLESLVATEHYAFLHKKLEKTKYAT